MRHLPSGDTGDIVVGWLVRLVACLALAGVVTFDGISLGVADLDVTDAAAAASRTASATLVAGGSPQAAYDAAWHAVARPSVELPVDGFLVGPARSVTVTVHRTVATLVLHRVPGSGRWVTVSATATHPAG